jgi:hypothetical protein
MDTPSRSRRRLMASNRFRLAALALAPWLLCAADDTPGWLKGSAA